MKRFLIIVVSACLFACAPGGSAVSTPAATLTPAGTAQSTSTVISSIAPPGAAGTPNAPPGPTPTIFPTPYTGSLTVALHPDPPSQCLFGAPFGLPSRGLDLLAFVPTGGCENGELDRFQIGDRAYIAQSGLFGAAFTLTDVTDPTKPQVLGVWDWQPHANTLDLKAFRQGTDWYLAFGLQRNRREFALPCGVAIVKVTDVRHPQFVTRLDGRTVGAPDPWCNVHTLEIDTDAQGSATYFIVSDVDTYSARAVDMRDLLHPREVNFYHLHVHPHSVPDQPVLVYVHDSYIAPDKIYLAYWLAGVVILDKQRFEAGLPQNPVIVKLEEGVAPGGFHVHYTIPLMNGAFLLIQDELNADNGIRLLDIRDPQHPKTVWVETNPGGVNAPHNFVVRDNLLYAAWYNDGFRVFRLDLFHPDHARVTPVASQEVRANKAITRERYFDGVWGVRVAACQVRSRARVCIYASDMSTGLIITALHS